MAGAAGEPVEGGTAEGHRDVQQGSEVGTQAANSRSGDGSSEQAGPVIDEQVAESLLRSLELLHADYAATLAAERRLQATNESQLTFNPPLREDGDADDGDSNGSHDDGALAGYAALGSEDGGSTASSEADPDETAATNTAANLNTLDSNGDAATENVPAAFTSPDEDDWADFGPANPALPGPPAPPPQLHSISLTDEQCQLIKETMLQVKPVAPSWAQNLSDRDLHRMVEKELARTTTAPSSVEYLRDA